MIIKLEGNVSNTKRGTILVELDLFVKYRGRFRMGPRLPISAINKTLVPRNSTTRGPHQTRNKLFPALPLIKH